MPDYNIDRIARFVRDARTYRTDWHLVYDYHMGKCISFFSGYPMPHMRSYGSIRDFIREGGPQARQMSDRQIAEALVDLISVYDEELANETISRDED